MFSCNSYLVLPIISIILIISIIILILYKNNQDNKITNKQSNKPTNYIIESFVAATDTQEAIINANNDRINALVADLNSIDPTTDIEKLYNQDNEQIDKNIQTQFAQYINATTDNIVDKTQDNDDIITDNITKLSNQVTDLENMLEKLHLNKVNDKRYSKIKSLNNGMELTLTQTPNTTFQDPQTGSNISAYMVNMNDGCLSVGATDYNIYKCNDKNQKHLFKMQHIINEQEYERNIDKSIPFDNVDKTKINYPFAMIKSVNNQNCLTNQNGNITVQPCYSFEAQRWMPI
jgi:hypothetical protein